MRWTDERAPVRDTAGTHGCVECELGRASDPRRVATDKVAAAPHRSAPLRKRGERGRAGATQRNATQRGATVLPVLPFPSIVAFLPSIAVQRSSGVCSSVRPFASAVVPGHADPSLSPLRKERDWLSLPPSLSLSLSDFSFAHVVFPPRETASFHGEMQQRFATRSVSTSSA